MSKLIEKLLTDKSARSGASLTALAAVLADAGAPWID